MQRDRGPNNSLAFGVTTGDLPHLEQYEGGNPEAGSIAQYFDKRPIQKFFATAGLTIVGAVVSGQVIRRAGLAGMSRAVQRSDNVFVNKHLPQYRRFQEALDNMEGVTRTRGQRFLDDGRVVDDPTRDETENLKGFFFSYEERKAMGSGASPSAAEWLLRDEVQQQMVKGARRLPYELPAAYITQRVFSDRLLGNEQEQPVIKNWYTAPIDIVGDFAEQSMKNLAFAFLPFDATRGATKHGYNKLMLSTVEQTGGVSQGAREAMVDLREVLGLVGHEAADVISSGLRYSRKTTGAASRAIHETVSMRRDTPSHLHSMRHGEDGLAGYLKRIWGQEEVVTPLAQARYATNRFRTHYRDPEFEQELFGVGYGRSTFERMVASINRMQAKPEIVDELGRPIAGTARDGTVREAIQADRYRSALRSAMREQGISADDARSFTDDVRITLPSPSARQVHISRRITTQRGQVFADDENWEAAFETAIRPRFGDSSGAIAQSLNKAIGTADEVYKRTLPQIQAEADNQFQHLFRHAMPKHMRDTLGKVKSPYTKFGPGMDRANSEFLVRKSAERAGIPIHNPAGRKVSTSHLKTQLANRGFDPNNQGQLRAYLINKGDISKPWSRGGFNAFGFRPLSVQEALDENAFRGSGYAGPAQDIAEQIKNLDWDQGVLSRMRAGGLYRTSSGGIVNFNPIRESARNFMDALADQVKVPLIQLKPLQMLGYGMKQEIDAQDFFQFTAGGRHPFLDQQGQAAQGLLWARAARSKGRVTAVTQDATTREYSSTQLSGRYTPLPTDPISLAGKSARLGYGDTGRRPGQPLTKLQEAMDWDPYKGHSLIAAVRRVFSRRDGDIMDPSVFAEIVQDSGVNGIYDQYGAARASEAGRNFISYLRKAAFSSGIHARIGRPGEQGAGQLARAMSGEILDEAGKPTRMRFSDMTPGQLVAYARRVMAPQVDATADPARQRMVNQLRSNLDKRWGQELDSISRLGRSTSPGRSRAGIHRQIDELRQDLVGFNAIEEGLMGAKSNQGFANVTRSMMDEVDSLFGRGIIGSREAAQARAAIGRIEYDYLSLTPGSTRDLSQDRTRTLLNRLIGAERVEGSTMPRILSDTYNYETSSVLGKYTQKYFGASRYRFDGYEFDPFGQASNFTLTPTFGTAFSRDPMGAVLSVTGFNTWSKPENFSTASIPVTHLFERMNKAVGIFGLGVDSMQYRGPLDMFARGNIGKRMLPLFAGGATLGALDRTAGGYLYNERDADGDRIYKPLVGTALAEVAAAGQVTAATITPWGRTGEEMEEHLRYGDVAVRKGRFWPLGNCVAPDQLIQVDSGEFKRADEVEEGDLVLTHEGVRQPVLRVITRTMKKTEWTPEVELHTIPFTNITTDNHPYYAVKKKHCPNGGTPDCRPDRNSVVCDRKTYGICDLRYDWTPEWTEAGELEPGDYLAYPRLKLEGNTSTIEGMPANREVGYMLGLYLAEGNRHRVIKGKAYSIEFSLHEREMGIVERVSSVVKELFGLDGKIVPKNQHGIKVRFFSVVMGEIFNKIFHSSGSGDKSFIKNIYDYPLEFILGVLDGLYDGDGHTTKRSVDLTSARLSYILHVRNILFSLGIENSVTHHDTTIGEKQFTGWRLSTSGDAALRLSRMLRLEECYVEEIGKRAGASKYTIISDNFVYIKIKKIKDSGYRGVVYDYEIQESHSFCSVSTILHNTSFWGGAPEYYRPNWYRRMHGAYQYTDQHFGSPMERLMYGYDFSPGRIINPYHYEQKHMYDRPYPVSGDYFTGPWGPLTPALNMTVGRVLKPRITGDEFTGGALPSAIGVPIGRIFDSGENYHQQMIQNNMARFQQHGAYGMAPPSTTETEYGEPTIYDAMRQYDYAGVHGVESYSLAAIQGPAYPSGTRLAYQQTMEMNDRYLEAVGRPSLAAREQAGAQAGLYPYIASGPVSSVPYQRPTGTVLARYPDSPGSFDYQFSDLSYRLQEYSGIYGFAFGAARQALGFGEMEYDRPHPILQPASQAYGFGRQFWDLGLGGLGDVPTPLEGQFSNIEISEVVRRFIPDPRNQDYINPIPNVLGQQYDWLPGEEYIQSFRTGDPYTAIREGEMRLPGKGYERFNRLSSDETGRYGRLDRLKILGGVAPYSQQYRQTLNEITSQYHSPLERMEIEEVLDRVAATTRRYEFDQRPYRDGEAPEGSIPYFGQLNYLRGRITEGFLHQDTYVHKKFIGRETAVENWERDHVYGSSFPEWGTPIESFVKPALYKSTDRNPIKAASMLGFLGVMMGATPASRVVMGSVGGVIGASGSLFGGAYKAITGDRYMPADRRKELALEEYADILEYTRSLRGFNVAQAQGDSRTAQFFRNQMQSTMYGVDLYDSTPEELERALPKRKREHFREMLFAPERDRKRILSTAGRLERRIYQAAWGMDVERRPDLEAYFEDRELPPMESEIYDPRIDMDMIKIKMIQNEGLNTSQMGYYPQQVREANLVNPSYPRFTGYGSGRNTRAQLQALMSQNGMNADIREVRTPFPGVRVNMQVGVG